MVEVLSEKQAAELGIGFKVKRAHGELHARVSSGIVSVCITHQAGKVRRWQSAHYHDQAREAYEVIVGSAILVTQSITDTVWMRLLRPGVQQVLAPGVVHTLALARGSTLVTIKSGFSGSLGDDWFSAPSLDAFLRGITQEEVRRRLGAPIPPGFNHLR